MQSKPMDFYPNEADTGNVIEGRQREEEIYGIKRRQLGFLFAMKEETKFGNLCFLCCCYLRTSIGGTKRMKNNSLFYNSSFYSFGLF